MWEIRENGEGEKGSPILKIRISEPWLQEGNSTSNKPCVPAAMPWSVLTCHTDRFRDRTHWASGYQAAAEQKRSSAAGRGCCRLPPVLPGLSPPEHRCSLALLQAQPPGSGESPMLAHCQSWEPRGFSVTLATIPCLPFLSVKQRQVLSRVAERRGSGCCLPTWQ